jgi:endonuclease/exonuclease/phosphatase family metal-dependent hydrolase
MRPSLRAFALGMALAFTAAAAAEDDPDLRPLPPYPTAPIAPPSIDAPPVSESTPTADAPAAPVAAPASEPAPVPRLRIATFNTSLYDARDGGLVARLASGDDAAARKIAAVIQHQRPDIVLLNEFDFDAWGKAADAFQRNFLAVGQHGQAPIDYPHRYFAPVNTGVASGMDLNRDGKVGGTGREYGEDAYGYGEHPGQYGMLLLSKFPIDTAATRTFQLLPWHKLPGAKSPIDPATNGAWYPPEIFARLRLSSKSHWDVAVDAPAGRLHVLAAHPTPPVFDGPENRNGIRNFDEVRLWSEYLSPGEKPWLCDDQGRCGGLAAGERFVILGDHNTDPNDGDALPGAMAQVLDHPRVQPLPAPRSRGAVQSARADGGANLTHKGDPAEDTGSFGPRVGNLRLDYVLPSHGLRVVGSGVFWPMPGEVGSEWLDATDHRMVWVDIDLE